METVLIIALVIAALAIGYLLRNPNRQTSNFDKESRLAALAKDAPPSQPEMLPGVRREAALQRHTPKVNEKIFSVQAGGRRRRFFFDVEAGSNGKYLRISEVESQKGKKDNSYTLMVFEYEIRGFQKALNAAADKFTWDLDSSTQHLKEPQTQSTEDTQTSDHKNLDHE